MTRNEKFFGKDWAVFLEPFLSSKVYENIGHYLIDLRKQGIEITPDLKIIFRAFSECPLHKLHTVILGMDPYSDKTSDGDFVADGLAFSARNSVKAPKSLNTIYEAIDMDVMHGNYVPKGEWNPHKVAITHSLKDWANSGILLLNCGLTTIVGRSNEHIPLWRPFIDYVMWTLNKRKDGLGFILMGSHAKKYRGILTNTTFGVFDCEHPVAGHYQHRAWNHENVFSRLTEWQQKYNNVKIDW